MQREPRILNCIILNPPSTPEEREAFEKRAAKALALAIYRSLGPDDTKRIIMCLEAQQKERMALIGGN
jgi:hypothetical protein